MTGGEPRGAVSLVVPAGVVMGKSANIAAVCAGVLLGGLAPPWVGQQRISGRFSCVF